MKILVDTRQKKDKHDNVDNYFKNNDIEIISKTLKVGDYMLSENAKISVDSKQNIYEIVSDLFGKYDKCRFQKECLKAKNLGIKLYILIEQKINKKKLLNWKSKRKSDGKLITKVNGQLIYERMKLYSYLFSVKWRFCNKKDTGETILKLLGVEDGLF